MPPLRAALTAHQLDGEGGAMDGAPDLGARAHRTYVIPSDGACQPVAIDELSSPV
jgi:hypothetical protein